MIGMDMGINDVSNLYVIFLGYFHKPVFVAQNRIDSDSHIAAATAEDVRKCCLFSCQLAEKHVVSLEGSVFDRQAGSGPFSNTVTDLAGAETALLEQSDGLG